MPPQSKYDSLSFIAPEKLKLCLLNVLFFIIKKGGSLRRLQVGHRNGVQFQFKDIISYCIQKMILSGDGLCE